MLSLWFLLAGSCGNEAPPSEAPPPVADCQPRKAPPHVGLDLSADRRLVDDLDPLLKQPLVSSTAIASFPQAG